MAEEICLLSDSAKEKANWEALANSGRITKTRPPCLEEDTGLLTTGCSSHVTEAKGHPGVGGVGCSYYTQWPSRASISSNYLLPLVTFDILELAYGHNQTLPHLPACLPCFPVKQ